MNDITNPLQNTSYTNKDFTSVYTELLDLVKQLSSKWNPSISNESDPGVILLKLNALIADKCNYAIDKGVLECFPLSVTQETNARHLFEQLGYYMHWYKSATTQVALTWVGEEDTASKSGYYIIPAFTMVSDADNSVIYTLVGPYEGTTTDTFIVGDMQLPCVGQNRTIKMKAIQGVAVDYTIGGSNLITPDKLDENNRLYFDTTDIAQNGIFISNVNTNNYSQWVQKENLLIENIGNTYYTFGVTDDGANCYLEFPSDVYSLFADGVVIKYIKTDNIYGNIAANTLSKFHADFTAYDESGNIQVTTNDQQITLNGENVRIVNPTSANNAYDKETINEAYKGYKSTVGTFNTLVTLRDYINAIRKSGLVSNCFVCDRTNDIQTAYKVIPAVSDSESPITITEEDHALNAFTLKLYATSYALKPQTKTEFLNSFYMLPNDAQDNIKSYISDQQTILHDYADLLTPNEEFSNICYFKNKYPIECTVITQANLSNVQKNIILNNIKLALYENLNASQIEFGDEISYQFVYDVIKNADNRISAVSLNTINYETYAVYYSEGETITYNDGKWYDENGIEVNPEMYFIDVENPNNGATEVLPPHFREVLISTEDDNPIFIQKQLTNADVSVDADTYMSKLDCDKWYRPQTFKVATVNPSYRWVRKVSSASDAENYYPYESYINDANAGAGSIQYAYGIAFTTTVSQNSSLQISYTSSLSDSPTFSGSVTTQLNNEDTFKAKVGVGSIVQYYKYEPIPEEFTYNWTITDSVSGATPQAITEDISNYGITITQNSGALTQNDFIKTNVSLKTQMRNEIYAKSVLAGKTQFFIQDETFDFRLDQKYHDIVDNIEYLSTNVDIDFYENYPNINDTRTAYTLKPNEYLQFYVPNLLDSTSYSTYVKMEYILYSDKDANTNFELQQNEFIIFYWKTTTDDDGSLYDYAIYSQGNIFNTSFAIPSCTDTSSIVGYNLIQRDEFGNILDSSITGASNMTVDISRKVESITSPDKILSGTKTITLKKMSQINVTSDSGYYMYWVLNTSVGNKYRLFSALPQYQTNVAYAIKDMFIYQSEIYVVNSSITAVENTSFDNIVSKTSVTVQNRVLNQGEYFIYTDSTQTNMSILGAGTRITRSVANTNWDVTIIDTTNITTEGIGIFYDADSETSYWFTEIGNATLTLTENQFITLSPGMKVQILPNNISDVYSLQKQVLNVSGGTPTVPTDLTADQVSVDTVVLYSKLQLPLTTASGIYNFDYDSTAQSWQLDANNVNLEDYGIQIIRTNASIDPTVEINPAVVERGFYTFTYGGSTWTCDFENENQSQTETTTGISTTTLHDTYAITVSGQVSGDIITYTYLSTSGTATPEIQNIFQNFADDDEIKLTVKNSWKISINNDGYTINVDDGLRASNPTLADFTVKYKTSNDAEYVSLPDVSLQSFDGWDVYSLLAINVDNLSSQEINQNQTISYITSSGATGSIEYGISEVGNPFYILSSTAITNYGGTNISVAKLDNDGNVILPSIYIFKVVQSQSPTIVYNNDGGVLFTFNSDTLTNTIDLALPVGEYILPLKHGYETLTSVQLYATVDGTDIQLHAMGDDSVTNFNEPNAYYIYLKVDSTDEFSIKMTVDDPHKNINLKLDNCYKYVKPENVTDAYFNYIQKLIFKLSKDMKYKYTHINNPLSNIENPLDAFQFLNSNHIYNKFTICQMDSYKVVWG